MATETMTTQRRTSIQDIPFVIMDVVNAERRVSVGSYPDVDQKQPDRRMSIAPKPMPASHVGQRILNAVRLFWAFTESDFLTFVIPNTMFGVFAALAGLGLVEGKVVSPVNVALRLPLIVWFNWYLTFLFDCANQRSPESVREDLINKPWRPLPSGKITPEETRRTMLFGVPIAYAMSYALGVEQETGLNFILVWLYNDLRGGDEIIRDAILAIAYGIYNLASLRIAIGKEGVVTERGWAWIAIVSGIILTTMQVQDLKDQEGDRTRGRKTAPLVLGETVSRWFIAVSHLVWSLVCSAFWQPGPLGWLPSAVLSTYIALRVVQKREPREDVKTWKLWCLWLIMFYFLPVIRLGWDALREWMWTRKGEAYGWLDVQL